jgi:hypothetical protein
LGQEVANANAEIRFADFEDPNLTSQLNTDFFGNNPDL